MNGYSRIRRQRLILEAEGYLDLILAAAGPIPTHAENRSRLARRAIHVLDQLEQHESSHVRAQYLRGQALRLMERYPQAVDAFEKAFAIDPSSVHVLLSMAWCYKRMGHLNLAIEALEDGLVLDPERAIVHYNLACYWSLLNQLDSALLHLSRAIELRPKYREFVPQEPDFDNVRNQPEFLAIAKARV